MFMQITFVANVVAPCFPHMAESVENMTSSVTHSPVLLSRKKLKIKTFSKVSYSVILGSGSPSVATQWMYIAISWSTVDPVMPLLS